MPVSNPNLVPGQPITDAQKAELAAFNEQESKRAHELAAQHRAQDLQTEEKLESEIAESIGKKLNPDHLMPPGAVDESVA